MKVNQYNIFAGFMLTFLFFSPSANSFGGWCETGIAYLKANGGTVDSSCPKLCQDWICRSTGGSNGTWNRGGRESGGSCSQDYACYDGGYVTDEFLGSQVLHCRCNSWGAKNAPHPGKPKANVQKQTPHPEHPKNSIKKQPPHPERPH